MLSDISCAENPGRLGSFWGEKNTTHTELCACSSGGKSYLKWIAPPVCQHSGGGGRMLSQLPRNPPNRAPAGQHRARVKCPGFTSNVILASQPDRSVFIPRGGTICPHGPCHVTERIWRNHLGHKARPRCNHPSQCGCSKRLNLWALLLPLSYTVECSSLPCTEEHTHNLV